VGKRIHAIVDNYAAHKHPNVRRWLGRHPRWPFHFTPISASWLNAVEGFFATLDRHLLILGVALLGRGNQRGVDDLPAHRDVTGCAKRGVEPIEQRLDRLRLCHFSRNRQIVC
jgi:hypothetical protein